MLDLEGGVGEQQEEGMMTISRILTNLFNSVLGEQYKCDVCDLVLKNKYNLRDHVSVLHTPRQPPLKCTKDFVRKPSSLSTSGSSIGWAAASPAPTVVK